MNGTAWGPVHAVWAGGHDGSHVRLGEGSPGPPSLPLLLAGPASFGQALWQGMRGSRGLQESRPGHVRASSPLNLAWGINLHSHRLACCAYPENYSQIATRAGVHLSKPLIG